MLFPRPKPKLIGKGDYVVTNKLSVDVPRVTKNTTAFGIVIPSSCWRHISGCGIDLGLGWFLAGFDLH
jgi:hypothetical protein